MSLWHSTVALDWAGPGSPGVNVWDIRVTDPPILSDRDSVEDAMAAIRTFYLASDTIFPNPYTITFPDEVISIPQTQLEVPERMSITPASTLAVTTGVSGFQGPSMLCLTLRTAAATRSGRGRKFLGPVHAALQDDDGTPNSAALTAVRDGAAALLAASEGGGGWSIGVWSATDNLFRDVTAVAVRDYFAVLRSRRD